MPMAAPALTPDERVAYPYLFSKADTDQIGVLVGEKAVAFFAHSKLPPTILGEIWQLADDENAGFLTRQQFDVALRLIGKAQAGLPINEAAVSTPGPLCRLEGITIPGIAPPLVSTPANDPLSQISSEDQARYTRMFLNAGTKEGLLEGDKARDIFVRSKLPFEKLGQIWSLADTHSRGALSVGDFCIAMHLIQLSMSGTLSSLPSALPPSLLESTESFISRAKVPPLSRQTTGQRPPQSLPTPPAHRQSSLNSSATPSLQPQLTGQSAISNPLLKASFGIGSPTRLPWDVSPAELAQSNIYFDSLDTSHQGFITGDRAVPFMMESKLPGEILARIWDLADIRGEGKLSREEFAVAMRLIHDTLAGGNDSLIYSLPATMVPPSLREPQASLPPILETSDMRRDLLSLMDDDESAPDVSKPQQGSRAAPQLTGASLQSTPVTSHVTGTSVKSPGAVVPTSPLSLSAVVPQSTGQSLSNRLVSSPGSIEDSGARLGNLHTQIASTENALSQARTEKPRLEADLRSTTEQIETLELKLSTARAALHSESTIVAELKARLAEQHVTLNKLTAESITAESELSALKVEKDQVQTNILRDKEEIRDMKKKISGLEEENQTLKSTLETLRKDSRLQRGLLAISKKQVATIEESRNETAAQVANLRDSLKELAPPSGASPASSPTHSSHIRSAGLPQKSTNPFEQVIKAPSTPQSSATDPSADQSLPRSFPHLFGLQPSEDPFHSGQGMPETRVEPPRSALSFGDAFGFKDPENEVQATAAQKHEFEDPFSGAKCDIQAQGTSSMFAIADVSQPAEKPMNEDSSPSDELSSDENEIEEVTSTFTKDLKMGKTSSPIDSKFPPLEDVEASFCSPSKIRSSSLAASTSSNGGFFSPQGDKFEATTSNDSQMAEARTDELRGNLQNVQNVETITSSIKSPHPDPNFSVKVTKSAEPSNVSDELEIADFAAGFVAVEPKTSDNTLEDFDSAFASLPLRSSKTPTSPSEAHSLAAAFDDTFGDAFVPAGNDKSGAHVDFAESLEAFDSVFQPKPSAEEKLASQNLVDCDSSEAPPLPSRPQTSKIPTNNSDGAKPDDSDSVKQICSMGFGRAVVIEALERDDWNVERALNHLLGS